MRRKYKEEDLIKIREHFYKLIIETAIEYKLQSFLNEPVKKIPFISNNTKRKGIEWFAIEGMYGGFAYYFKRREVRPVLVVSSWVRTIQGSGKRYEITTYGCKLVEEGFV